MLLGQHFQALLQRKGQAALPRHFLTRHNAPHVAAHVGKVQVRVCDSKVHVKLRDLLAQQQQVHDCKQLAVQGRGRLCHNARRHLCVMCAYVLSVKA